ncbi:Phytosulfokine receptor 2 [Carex littledalei]|uniref:Phytosulfokine receptor 2 n=1 Tax=Carex littledalei TaxID=544730 RepID=A0A833VX40_9POAL|nr:Phytosulfokine receptor 2 [Carex littledalei]
MAPSLNLNNNGLNGLIWPEFGNLKLLHVLDLSHNGLTGHIPDSIADMENLEVLDLSFNNLNGSIPASLSKLTFLSKFSVAHSHLEGIVPTDGQVMKETRVYVSQLPVTATPLTCNWDSYSRAQDISCMRKNL